MRDADVARFARRRRSTVDETKQMTASDNRVGNLLATELEVDPKSRVLSRSITMSGCVSSMDTSVMGAPAQAFTTASYASFVVGLNAR